jgi:hypothetical protein
MEVRSRMICEKGKSAAQCKSDFLHAHPEFEHVKVLGDGNCFFRSIAAYYERNPHLKIDGVHNPTDYDELRRYVVHRFRQQIENEAELREIYLPALNQRPIETILSELATTCKWDVPAFEMMVERTAPILNINVRLFRMNREKIDQNKPFNKNNTMLTITESFYPSRTPVPTTISIFLVGGHYELLYSLDASNASNKIHNNQIKANAAFAAKIAASSPKKHGKPKVGTFPSPKASPIASPIASPNASPNVASNSYHSTSSVSSIESLNNSLFIENAREKFPYKQMTIPTIKDSLQIYKLRGILDKYGITYYAKDKKEVLYGAFMDAYIANTKEKTKNILKKKKQETMHSKQGGKMAYRITRKNKQR